MKIIEKIIVLSLITILLFVLTLLTFSNNLINYSIIFAMITLIMFIYLCYIILYRKDDKSVYKRKLKRILKEYDSQLVYVDDISMQDKNIIFIKNIIDLIDISVEFKKTVNYIEEERSSVFFIEYDKDIIMYVLKENKETISKIEEMAKKQISENKNNKKEEERILNLIDKTTIIQLKNNKLYKIKPIKK